MKAVATRETGLAFLNSSSKNKISLQTHTYEFVFLSADMVFIDTGVWFSGMSDCLHSHTTEL